MITRNINYFTKITEYLVHIFNYVLTCALHIVTQISKSIIWWRRVISSSWGNTAVFIIETGCSLLPCPTNEYASDKPIN